MGSTSRANACAPCSRSASSDGHRAGQIIENRRGEYCLTAKLDLVTGIVSGHPDGFGFVRRDDGDGDDVYLSAREMRSLFDGDRVAYPGRRPGPARQAGRQTGRSDRTRGARSCRAVHSGARHRPRHSGQPENRAPGADRQGRNRRRETRPDRGRRNSGLSDPHRAGDGTHRQGHRRAGPERHRDGYRHTFATASRPSGRAPCASR